MYTCKKSDNSCPSKRHWCVASSIVAHCSPISARNLWVLSGTSENRKYINIREIYNNHPSGSIAALPPFHAYTGHSKKSAWAVAAQQHELLLPLEEGELNVVTLKSAEKFVCLLFAQPRTSSMRREASCSPRSANLNCMMLPTRKLRNALASHAKWAHFQTLVWTQVAQAHYLWFNGRGKQLKSKRNSLKFSRRMTKVTKKTPCEFH